ncbi:MAG: hypothetical protein FWG52_02085 [Proteobacteria bacterium]|nr:hypothetical protein [Pseudomonadota bacterium]
MNFDEFKQAVSKMKRDGLINLAWEHTLVNYECTEACLILQEENQTLAEVSNFMSEIIKRHGLEGELKGEEIERYIQSRKENHSKGIEAVKRAISLSNALSIREDRSNTTRMAAKTRHSQPGGSNDKRKEVIEMFKTGKYRTKTDCAEEASHKLDISFDMARKALVNVKHPSARSD